MSLFSQYKNGLGRHHTTNQVHPAVMAHNLAASIIRDVRGNLQTFEERPLYLAVRLAYCPNQDAVVNALPRLLLTEPTRVIVCLHFCLSEIDRFSTFNLLHEMRMLRGRRVKGG